MIIFSLNIFIHHKILYLADKGESIYNVAIVWFVS